MALTKREWRRRYEATATREQLTGFYEADTRNHDENDRFCICDRCMAPIWAEQMIDKNTARQSGNCGAATLTKGH